MSGRKYSRFRLKWEREQKLRLLQSIRSVHTEVNALKERLADMIAGAPAGLRSTFAGEVEHTEGWLSSLDLPEVSGLNMRTDLARLHAIRTELERAAARGRELRKALTIAFTQKADEMGQRLAKRLADVEELYLSHRQVLSGWVAHEHTQQWENVLQGATRWMDRGEYVPVEEMLAEVEEDIAARVKLAEEQEDAHQKRLYLLRALRQVCADMGFGEVEPPRYEREHDRASRILFTVDTWDRGKIAFHLSLDGISSFSEIAEDHCFEEFGQLSQYLDEAFGIHTEFHLTEGESAPRLIQKGEMDEPEHADMKAEA